MGDSKHSVLCPHMTLVKKRGREEVENPDQAVAPVAKRHNWTPIPLPPSTITTTASGGGVLCATLEYWNIVYYIIPQPSSFIMLCQCVCCGTSSGLTPCISTYLAPTTCSLQQQQQPHNDPVVVRQPQSTASL